MKRASLLAPLLSGATVLLALLLLAGWQAALSRLRPDTRPLALSVNPLTGQADTPDWTMRYPRQSVDVLGVPGVGLNPWLYRSSRRVAGKADTTLQVWYAVTARTPWGSRTVRHQKDTWRLEGMRAVFVRSEMLEGNP